MTTPVFVENQPGLPINERKYKTIKGELTLIPNSTKLDDISKIIMKYHHKIVPFSDGYLHNLAKNERELSQTGYLFSDHSGQKFDIKTIDKLYDYYELYGYHTYGGCPTFFRPDVVEVFWLLMQHIKENDLEKCKKIYCTTNPYPDESNKCYDHVVDRHKGFTQVWITY